MQKGALSVRGLPNLSMFCGVQTSEYSITGMHLQAVLGRIASGLGSRPNADAARAARQPYRAASTVYCTARLGTTTDISL
jgi:hypothetical protein